MREERALKASRGSVSVDFLSRGSSTRSGVLLASLIALACSAVNGCGSVPKHGHDVTPTSGAVEQKSSTPSPQESSVRLARWKSCAEMAHPNGYSTADLDAMFERPKSIQQLLQNLKLASERDLLLQPQFYDELTAQKFSAGAKVTRSTPEGFGNATDVKLVLSVAVQQSSARPTERQANARLSRCVRKKQ